MPDLRQPLHRPPWALLCWTLLWWAPFAVSRHTLPLTSFDAEALAALLGALGTLLTWWPVRDRTPAAWCDEASPTGSTRPDRAAPQAVRLAPLVPLLIGWGGWALLVLVQPLLRPTVAPELNLAGAAGMALALLVMLGGAGSRRWAWSDRTETWIAATLVIGGLLTVAGQLLQLIGFDELYGPLVMTMAPGTARRLFGNLGQANHAATYLVWGIAGMVFLLQRPVATPSGLAPEKASDDHGRRAWPWWAWAGGMGLIGVMDLGLAFTGSRTPIGQLLVLTAVGVWSGWSMRRTMSMARVLGPLLLLPLMLVVQAAVTAANHRWAWGLADPAQRWHDPGQLSPRMALWKGGWSIFQQAPWLGTGWGDYAWQQYRTVLAVGPVEPAFSAHNLVLDLLARTGAIGAVLVLMPLVLWAGRQCRGTMTAGRGLALALIGTLGVHALVEFPETYLFFLLPVAFLMGRWGVVPARGESSIAPTVAVRPPFPAGADVRTGLARGLAGLALLAGVIVAMVMLGYRQAETAMDDVRVPALGVLDAPRTHGLGHLFDPWLDALSWPHRLAHDPTDAMEPGFDARMARTLALAPRVDHMRRFVIALAVAGRDDTAWDAMRRWALLSQGYERWPEERMAMVEMLASDPSNVHLRRLQAHLATLP